MAPNPQQALRASTLLLSLSLLAPSAALADEEEGASRNASGVFSTFGVQRAETDFDNLGEAINIGGSFGVQFGSIPLIGPGLGIELALQQTIRPGDNEGQPSILGGGGGGGDGGSVLDPITGGGDGGGGGGSGGGDSGRFTSSDSDFVMQSLGGFLSYRTPTTLYAIAKIGYAYTDTNIPELDDDRENVAWQLGAGFRYGSSPVGVELAYARYSSEVDAIGLTIGTDFE